MICKNTMVYRPNWGVWGGGIDDNGEGVKWMIVLHFLRIPVFTTKTFGFICVLVWMSVCGCWCRWRTFSL